MMAEILELVRKDLVSEFRSKSVVSTMLLFSVTAAFLFSAAIPKQTLQNLLSPLLLVIFFFCGVLGYSISFLREFDSGTIEGLKSSPVTPFQIVLGKMLFNIILMLSIQSILIPVCYALFDAEGDFALFFIIFAICNTSLAVTITSLSPLTSKSRARELLIPVVIFPVTFPVITATLRATEIALSGSLELNSLFFLLSYTVTIVAISYLVSDYAV